MKKDNQTSAQQAGITSHQLSEGPIQEKTADFFSRAQRRHNQQKTDHQHRPKQATSLPVPHRFTVPAMTIGMNIVWWQQPLLYHQIWQNAGTWQIWSLLAYSLFSAMALGFLVKNRFDQGNWRIYLSVLSSLLVIFNSQLRSRFEVLALLILLSSFLLILPWPTFQLKNALGLLGLSILLTFSVPICISYLANNYVEPDFLKESWLLVFACAFYLTPLLLPTANGRRLELVTGPLLILASLLLAGWSLTTGIIVTLALASFCLTFIRPLTYKIQPLVAILALVITTMAYYH